MTTKEAQPKPRGRQKGQKVISRPREVIQAEKQSKLRERSNRYVNQSRRLLLGRDSEVRAMAQADTEIVIHALESLLEQSRNASDEFTVF